MARRLLTVLFASALTLAPGLAYARHGHGGHGGHHAGAGHHGGHGGHGGARHAWYLLR